MLWWVALKNGLPESIPNWKNIDIGSKGVQFNALTDMSIYDNKLIINYNTGLQRSFVLPLFNIATDTTSPAIPTTTSESRSTSASTKTTESSTSTITTKVSGSSTSGSGSSGSGSSGSGSSGSGSSSSSGSSTSGSGSSGSGSSGSSGSGSSGSTSATGSSGSGSGGSSTISLEQGVSAILNGIGMAAKNGINTELGVQGVNGNLGNTGNLNDFMKDASLLGNNIYISPMNNDEIYKPSSPTKSFGKISSSFFPMVKIN
jgi:hypothetical protein